MEINVLERFFWIWSVFSLFVVRTTTTEAATLYLHKIEIKKRKKGQSFFEWFNYIRFREELPKRILLFYYVVMNGNIIVILIVLFTTIYNINVDKLMWFSLICNTIWMLYSSCKMF